MRDRPIVTLLKVLRKSLRNAVIISWCTLLEAYSRAKLLRRVYYFARGSNLSVKTLTGGETLRRN